MLRKCRNVAKTDLFIYFYFLNFGVYVDESIMGSRLLWNVPDPIF